MHIVRDKNHLQVEHLHKTIKGDTYHDQIINTKLSRVAICGNFHLFPQLWSTRLSAISDTVYAQTHAPREIGCEQLHFHSKSAQLKYQGGMCPPTADWGSNLHSQIPRKVQLKSQIQRYPADIPVVGSINLEFRPQMTNSDFSLNPMEA